MSTRWAFPWPVGYSVRNGIGNPFEIEVTFAAKPFAVTGTPLQFPKLITFACSSVNSES